MELREPSIVDFNDTVSRAFSEIVKTGISVIVTKDGKYFGLIGDRDVRQTTIDPAKTKCGSIAVRAPHLTPKSTIPEMCRTFFSVRFKALPVLQNNKILGTIARADLVKMLLENGLLQKRKVSEVMTAPAVTIESGETVAKAKALMKKYNVRRIIVTENNRLVGILSTFDLVSSSFAPKQSLPFLAQKSNIDMQPVKSQMREETHVIDPEKPTSDAAKMMVENNVSAIIVSKGSIPLGIITARDLFETIIKEAEKELVYISGLEGEDRNDYEAIHDEAKRLIDKLGKGIQIESIAIHVKKYGNKYAVRARAETKRGMISVSSEAWEIYGAIKDALDEIKKIALKSKPSQIHHE